MIYYYYTKYIHTIYDSIQCPQEISKKKINFIAVRTHLRAFIHKFSSRAFFAIFALIEKLTLAPSQKSILDTAAADSQSHTRYKSVVASKARGCIKIVRLVSNRLLRLTDRRHRAAWWWPDAYTRNARAATATSMIILMTQWSLNIYLMGNNLCVVLKLRCYEITGRYSTIINLKLFISFSECIWFYP